LVFFAPESGKSVYLVGKLIETTQVILCSCIQGFFITISRFGLKLIKDAVLMFVLIPGAGIEDHAEF
jgi:hypothetical protein